MKTLGFNFKRFGELHNQFLKKYSSNKLTNMATAIGGISGFIYLNEYYTKEAFNFAAEEWNKLNPSVSNQTKQSNSLSSEVYDLGIINMTVSYDVAEDTVVDIKFNTRQVGLYQNLFSAVIIPTAPYSVNFLTTAVTGSVVGRLFAKYLAVTLPITIAYNVLNNHK